MTYVALGDIAFHKMGGTPSTADERYWEAGDLLWATPGDLGKGQVLKIYDTARKITASGLAARNAALFPAGTVLLSTTATIGNIGLATCPIYCNQQITAIVPHEGMLPEYLAYCLLRSKDDLMRLGGTSTATHINQKNLATLKIPVLPLPEQRHIVDLLSRAEGIVRLRQEAEKKATELTPALFLDMFGDPATNPKGWPVRKVSDFVNRFEGGKNIQAGSENGSPYRILKVSSTTSGIYRESESKPSPDGYNPPNSHIVRVGDMLFSRANTEELVGATAIVEKTDGKTLLPDKLWRFVWAEPIAPAYMHALFQSRWVRRELGKLSSGTSASMRNISQRKLFDLRLPIAPYERQQAFADQAASVGSILSQQSAALASANAAFDALLALAFR